MKWQLDIDKCLVVTETHFAYPDLQIKVLLRLIDLAKSTYYDWRKSKMPRQRYFDSELRQAIKDCFVLEGRSTYGAKRIAQELRGKGLKISAKKVLRYMKMDALVPNNYQPPAPIKPEKPERNGKYPRIWSTKAKKTALDKYPLILCGDITEENIAGGKVYTCAWIDPRTNKIYGLVTDNHKGRVLLAKSLDLLIREIGDRLFNALLHTDNGSEFKSYFYKLFAMAFDITLSMSRVGRSTDNGYIEGFWSRMKTEALGKGYFNLTFDDYAYNLQMYKNFYNTARIRLK